MIAAHNPAAERGVLGVNVVVLGDGREAHLDDIETAKQGRSILDEIDAAIIIIEGQIDRATERTDPGWLRRAKAALKKKRRIRPALQQRIGQLRRAEKRPAADVPTSRKDAQRKAFVTAAEQVLGSITIEEIWHRATENEPHVFEGWEGVSA